jgi:IS605 OrfB family transposase
MIRVFETRISRDEASSGKGLEGFAHLMSTAERKIHTFLMAGNEWTAENYASIYQKLGLSSTAFRSAKTNYDGKIDSVKELVKLNITTLEGKIKAKEKQAKEKLKENEALAGKVEKSVLKLKELKAKTAEQKKKLEALPVVKVVLREKALSRLKKLLDKADIERASIKEFRLAIKKNNNDIHANNRRVGNLQAKLETAEARLERPSIAFGSKKLFRKQNNLAKNGYNTHKEWLNDWRQTRKSSFFLVGARSAPGGNELVRLSLRSDGDFTLELRLPPKLADYATAGTKIKGRVIPSIAFNGLNFNHGHDVLVEALAAQQPLSFRFIRDERSWKVMVTVDQAGAGAETIDWSFGALGVDFNADHIAASLVDRFGNPVEKWRFDFCTEGKTSDQNLDAMRKIAKAIALLADRYGVPVVTEHLDFAKKKEQLGAAFGKAYAYMLSNLAYSSFDKALASACARHAVCLRRVNPAYTSLIGRIKFARRYGLSVHAAAAVTIARRAMALSERMPFVVQRDVLVPLDTGGHVTLCSPARKSIRHVWSSWNDLQREYKKATARAYASAGRAGGPPSRSKARRLTRKGQQSLRDRWATGPSSLSKPGVPPVMERNTRARACPGGVSSIETIRLPLDGFGWSQ